MAETFYRVWWAGGGYSHVDELPDNPTTIKHKNPDRDLDEPTRIDKIEIIYQDEKAEHRYESKRLNRITNG